MTLEQSPGLGGSHKNESTSSEQMNIRPLNCLDVKSAADIFRETFHFEEHKEFSPIWRDRSREESVGVFNDDGDLLGFILIFENQRCLKYIAVHPLFQKFGLGSMLLKHALKSCFLKGETLNLIPANDTVQAWYERQGFTVSSSFKASDGKVWPIMNFHLYWTRRHAKNLKRLHDSIQDERTEADKPRKQVYCGKHHRGGGKHDGGGHADYGGAGAAEPVHDYQDVARAQ